MAHGILSLEDIALMKFAIQICNNTDLKTEILHVSDDVKEKYLYDCKGVWNKEIEEKSVKILKYLQLTDKLQEKVTAVVLAIGMRMLTWAEYHEGTFGFSRDYSTNFLNSTLFTSQGIIDNKKAARELMNCTNLSIIQKYKLACAYCFTEHIPFLYRQMVKEDKNEFYDALEFSWVYQHGLIQFWSYYLSNELDKVKGEKSIDEFRFEKAIESGNIAAVEYCLALNKRTTKVIVNVALEAVVHSIIKDYDWIVFRKQRYDDKYELWTPKDYYVDIICLLLSKMSHDQRVVFLVKDITGNIYKKLLFERDRRPPLGIHRTNTEDLLFEMNRRHSRILVHFLNWPYQNYFLKMAELLWHILPECEYAILLIKISEKIITQPYRCLKYGEEKTYDYRNLLKTFWMDSPIRFKQFVFSNQEVNYSRDRKIKVGEELLTKLLTSTNFTFEDSTNIQSILECATDKEREKLMCSFISSSRWKNFCIGIIRQTNWDRLDRFAIDCFLSKNEVENFKRELSYMKETLYELVILLGNGNFEEADAFIMWSSLPEEEIHKLKLEMIFSYCAKRKLVYIFCREDNPEHVNKVLKWCFSSEEQIREFKSELVLSLPAKGMCRELIRENKLQTVDNFFKYCLHSHEKINEVKKQLVMIKGNFICEILISGCLFEYIYNDQEYLYDRTTEFEGGKWEEVDELLSWAFSSEEDICNFKRSKLFRENGIKIHFTLIKSNKLEEAVRFFAWLNLSDEEINEMKKETLYASESIKMFLEFVHNEDGDKIYSKFGSKQKALELLLKWYLTDKESVLEFRDKFKSKYREDYVLQEDEDNLNSFDLLIEQHLRELETENLGIERKIF